MSNAAEAPFLFYYPIMTIYCEVCARAAAWGAEVVDVMVVDVTLLRSTALRQRRIMTALQTMRTNIL